MEKYYAIRNKKYDKHLKKWYNVQANVAGPCIEDYVNDYIVEMNR